ICPAAPVTATRAIYEFISSIAGGRRLLAWTDGPARLDTARARDGNPDRGRPDLVHRPVPLHLAAGGRLQAGPARPSEPRVRPRRRLGTGLLRVGAAARARPR